MRLLFNNHFYHTPYVVALLTFWKKNQILKLHIEIIKFSQYRKIFFSFIDSFRKCRLIQTLIGICWYLLNQSQKEKQCEKYELNG